jgi:hypothetical protein
VAYEFGDYSFSQLLANREGALFVVMNFPLPKPNGTLPRPKLPAFLSFFVWRAILFTNFVAGDIWWSVGLLNLFVKMREGNKRTVRICLSKMDKNVL